MTLSPPSESFPPHRDGFPGRPNPPRFSRALRLVLGVVLMAAITLGGWLGIQLVFPFTTAAPVIPPSYLTARENETEENSTTSESPDPGIASETEPAITEIPAPASSTVASQKTDASQKRVPATKESGNDLGTYPALLARVRTEGDSEPAPYLDLGAQFSTLEDFPKAEEWLNQGLQKHPDSEDLILALADSVFAQGRADDAWRELARTGRAADIRFASRILRYGLAAEKYDETLVVLASAGSKTPSFTKSDWGDIIRLYERTGNFERAIELVDRHLTDRSELFRLRSLQQRRSGNLSEAIFNQEQYLARLDSPGADAWRDLASLYEAAGRVEEARRAHQQASGADVDEGAAPTPPLSPP